MWWVCALERAIADKTGQYRGTKEEDTVSMYLEVFSVEIK